MKLYYDRLVVRLPTMKDLVSHYYEMFYHYKEMMGRGEE